MFLSCDNKVECTVWTILYVSSQASFILHIQSSVYCFLVIALVKVALVVCLSIYLQATLLRKLWMDWDDILWRDCTFDIFVLVVSSSPSLVILALLLFVFIIWCKCPMLSFLLLLFWRSLHYSEQTVVVSKAIIIKTVVPIILFRTNCSSF